MQNGDMLRADVDPSRKHDFLLGRSVVPNRNDDDGSRSGVAAASDAINVVDDGYGHHASFCGGGVFLNFV